MSQQLTRTLDHRTLATLSPTLRNSVVAWRDVWEPLREGHLFIHDPEAADAASSMEAELKRRAEGQIVAQWVSSLSAGVTMNLPDEQYEARVSLIINMVGNRVPAFCWTQETLWAALKDLKWFPTVADLMEVFDPMIKEQEFAIETLRRIAHASPSPRFEESHEPYPVQMPPPVHEQEHQVNPYDPDYVNPRARLARPPERTVEDQLRELGFKS